MQIVKLSGTNEQDIINQTISVLKSGGLVVFPTDTVYGLLADSTNPLAVDKLLKFKDRPVGKAISVFVSDEKMAKRYIITNPNSTNIFKNLLPGPFTIVCKYRYNIVETRLIASLRENIDNRLLAENGTLGIRLPDYPLIIELVRRYGKPLTATSANLSGTPAHYNIHNISKGKRVHLIALIIDAGNLPKNKPSTVIDTTSGELKTLRLGDLLPNTSNSLVSKSENATRKLAGFILSKSMKKSAGKPIVFLLQGELGTGKTIFTKGLGKVLGVKEEIISPTYTICYEYKIGISVETRLIASLQQQSTKNPNLSTTRPIENSSGFDTEGQDLNIDYVDQESKLVHYDLYRIESPEDLKEIKFLESIKSGNIYAIEWPERIDEDTLSKLKETVQIVYITISHVDEVTREIKWSVV